MLERQPIAFPKLDEEQIAALRRFATLSRFEPGARLFAAGEIDVAFFVIEHGEVEIVDRSAGREALLAVHEAREFTGDVDTLTGRPAAVSAVARTACAAYRIAPAALQWIVAELPRLSEVLLRAFLMRRQLLEASGVAAVRLIGSRFCRDTHRLREFLARNKVAFAWIDLESDPNVSALLGRFGLAAGDTPVAICASGSMLRNPSNPVLAAALGLRKPLGRTVYDLAVIGAGPAGLSAALYGASEGLKTLVLDRIGPGGQAGTSPLIENYMGFPAGLSGADLASRALVQAHKFGATFYVPAQAASLRCEQGYHVLGIEGGEELAAKCLLVSTGASYRKLEAGDCERFERFGLYYAATAVEAELCRKARVVIVGGGNSAGQAAVYLAERTARVLLVMRGDDVRTNMSDYLARRIEHTPQIEVRCHTEVVRMHGERWLESVDLRDTRTGASERVRCPALFVFIGAVPHTGWLAGRIELDADGFVKTGQQPARGGAWPLARAPFLLETSCAGIFAAGDVRLGSIKRVACAIGEGAMAVKFAHEYLASR